MLTTKTPRSNPPMSLGPRHDPEERTDPYAPTGHLEKDSVCGECGAVYDRQHWLLDEPRRRALIATGAARYVVCPACQKMHEESPQGILTLRGDYWPEHRELLMQLIRNEEERARGTNPLERVMSIRDDERELCVETTNPKLAQKIGRAIHHAHQGELKYHWSKGDHLVRVDWVR